MIAPSPPAVQVREASTIPALSTIRAFLALTKPRIVELLLVTTVPSMMLAAGGWPGLRLVGLTLIGGTLSAAGANTLNCVIDRDIDAEMARTAGRPLPRSIVTPAHAAIFGTFLGVTGFVWLATLVRVEAALVATAALLFYVLVYTAWLKRRTTHNIVIGGAAGAAPPVVGWAAVTGEIASLPAGILFLVVFYWTPPHFWALALRYRSQYAAASVPMLPSVSGEQATTANMVAYALLTVIASVLLVPAASMGWFYILTAGGLGFWFVAETLAVLRRPERAMVLFVRSTLYLALLFAAVAADALLA